MRPRPLTTAATIVLLLIPLSVGCGTVANAPRSRATPTRAAAHPTPSAVRTAANGDNVADCLMGSCEVELGVPGTIELSAPPLTIEVVIVQVIKNGTVTLGIGPADLSRFHLACSGGTPPCIATNPGAGANAGSVTGGPGTVITANELNIDIETVDATTAILKLSTGVRG